MFDETHLIAEISQILKKGRHAHKFFVKTDLSSIVPDGTGGYSLNQQNRVTGLKLGGLTQEVNSILKIVSKFRRLERLVLYSNHDFELPPEVARTGYLKFVALGGAVKLPKELFFLNLELHKNRNRADRPLLLRDKSQIADRIKTFKLHNPSSEIERNANLFLSGKSSASTIKEDYHTKGLFRELELFCKTESARRKVISETGIFLRNNEAIKDPPYEILLQGIDAIKQYFEEKEKQGVERLFEAKIVIVGAGESGKTTLIKKLINPDHLVPNEIDKRTEGIKITSFPFRGITKFGTNDIQAHIWDFGGQELYHTTHQLFLTPDTLYILLNDNRKNDTDFYYWLNIVTIRAGENSPILLVFNAKGDAPRQITLGEEIFEAFPNLIKDSIDVNFAEKNTEGIFEMKRVIQSCFTGLDVIGKPFPALWVKIRNELSNLAEEHINWKKFSNICKSHGVEDASQIQLLAKTLHNLGVILYFPEVFGLDDLIILKSQWCIDAIYAALDTKTVDKNGGRFNEESLSLNWSQERFLGNHLQLLKLMQHFDLCYQVEGSRDYIAPQLLPLQQLKPLNLPSDWAINFQFQYLFMPSGLLTRLIARMSCFIKLPYAWRTGVILEWEEGTLAEVVEHGLSRKIVIKIKGSERKRRLLEIRRCLYDLHKDFRGLKFHEYILCNCSDCQKGGEASSFELAILEDDALHNDNVTCRNGTRKKIPAQEILNGINYEDKPRIFISYSHHNQDLKNEFRTMISPMEKEGHWKVWDDMWLLPGDKWNKEIVKHLNEANIIILMLTADFFASTYIYEVELTKAIQRHETDEALVIGILVSDCMWEETPLSNIEIVPKDGIPIDRSPNKNQIWKFVASKIKQAINARIGKGTRVGGWNNIG